MKRPDLSRTQGIFRLPTLFGSQATIVRTISQYRNRIAPNINIVGKGCFQNELHPKSWTLN